jgi:hypothetical protein
LVYPEKLEQRGTELQLQRGGSKRWYCGDRSKRDANANAYSYSNPDANAYSNSDTNPVPVMQPHAPARYQIGKKSERPDPSGERGGQQNRDRAGW